MDRPTPTQDQLIDELRGVTMGRDRTEENWLIEQKIVAARQCSGATPQHREAWLDGARIGWSWACDHFAKKKGGYTAQDLESLRERAAKVVESCMLAAQLKQSIAFDIRRLVLVPPKTNRPVNVISATSCFVYNHEEIGQDSCLLNYKYEAVQWVDIDGAKYGVYDAKNDIYMPARDYVTAQTMADYLAKNARVVLDAAKGSS